MRRMNVVNRKQALKVVKELDAFPKVPESYTETTATGGGVSILVFVFIMVLVVSEVFYYTNTELKFNYEVDTVHEGKLKINIDMTIAMRCNMIGADVLDLTGQSANVFGKLAEEDVYFELSPAQQRYMEMIQRVNSYIKSEYHAIHHFLWRTGYSGVSSGMPPREDKPQGAPNACRVHGTFTVNKVAGNFHVTAGKSVPVFPRGHAHLQLSMSDKDYNFSHRIDTFSFGDITPGIVNPLDGDYKVTKNNYHMYQYFIQVVPTHVNTKQAQRDAFQYAVTERNRSINHAAGSHGVPGIFVKYDLSPLKVSVAEVHKPYWKFLVRLCGIVGGIFATSGLLHRLVGFAVDCLCCRFKLGWYNRPKGELPPQPVPVNDAGEMFSEANHTSPTTSLLSAENNVPLLPQDGASYG